MILVLLLAGQFWSPGLADPRPLYHELSATWFNESASFSVPNAYFGFSITYVAIWKRLIVSAPQADNIGEVFYCNIDDKACSKLPRGHITRYIDEEGGNYNNSYWYGATVKAGPDYLLACAPLFTSKSETGFTKRPGTYGYCNKYRDMKVAPTRIKTLSFKDRFNKGEWTNIHEHQEDTLGWSIDIAGTKAIIGGPGMFTGRVVLYPNINLPDTTGLIGNSKTLYNFGYSVAIGEFIPNNMNKLAAVGSTFGKNGIGQVTLYSLSKKPALLSYLRVPTQGKDELELVGSMYGGVLCAAKLQARWDKHALLVGAPTYAESHIYNLGAVFVYLPDKQPVYHRSILGKAPGSHFGSAIVSIGDLNGDTIDEIAIGAPYEDEGRGAVYLYSGADLSGEVSDDSPEPMQKVVASSTHTFGFSLTPLLDYDDNGCNELAIGAPESNAVMLLRCIATATVEIYALIPPNLRDLKTVSPDIRNETHFKFQSCVHLIKYPIKIKRVIIHLNVSANIIHPHAKIVSPASKSYTVTLTDRIPVCHNIIVETTPQGNYEIPLHYELKVSQIDPPIYRSDFDPSHLAVSDLSTLTTSGEISITDCKLEICAVDMKYTGIKFNGINNDSTYVIGSSERVDMTLSFVNQAETAYDSCVFINVTSVSVMKPSSECLRINNNQQLKCAPAIKLRTNDIWDTQVIPLNMVDLTSADRSIRVEIALYDQCLKSGSTVVKPKTYEAVINLLSDSSGVKIKGITDSGKDEYVNATATELQQGKYFQQTYTITNSGPTTWVDVVATLEVEKKYFIVNNNETVKLQINDEAAIFRSECDLKEENNKKYVYECNIEKLTKNTVTAYISTTFYIIGEQFHKAVSSADTMTTTLWIDLRGEKISYTIVNKFLFIGLVWELWMILVAVLLGVLLLIILVVILAKRGCLRRKNKEQLEQIQQSVKRQTIMRKSMVGSHRQPDQEELLDATSTTHKPKKRLRIDSADCDRSKL